MRKLFFIITISMSVFYSSCSEHIVESTPSIDQILTNNNSVSPTFTDIQSKVFNKSCALSGCHIAGVQSPDLSVNAYNVIVSKSSTNGLNYIEPGDPNLSYMYLKLIGAGNISGSQMPKNGPPLSQSVLDSIKAWITNGALNN